MNAHRCARQAAAEKAAAQAAGEAEEGPLEAQGFLFGRLAERRPELKRELLSFRDHLLASSAAEGDEALKVRGEVPATASRGGAVACCMRRDLPAQSTTLRETRQGFACSSHFPSVRMRTPVDRTVQAWKMRAGHARSFRYSLASLSCACWMHATDSTCAHHACRSGTCASWACRPRSASWPPATR